MTFLGSKSYLWQESFYVSDPIRLSVQRVNSYPIRLLIFESVLESAGVYTSKG